MQIATQGKQMAIGDAFKEHIETVLADRIGKYFDGEAVDATVIVGKEAYYYCADIIVHPGKKGITVNAKASADEPYPAFEQAAELIAKRLRRYKTRLKDHHGQSHADLADIQNARSTVLDLSYDGSANDNEGAADHREEPAVIAEMETPIMTLTVSEAVMNLELGHHPALLFKNRATGAYNMLYRRADGNLGWVDPDGSLK